MFFIAKEENCFSQYFFLCGPLLYNGMIIEVHLAHVFYLMISDGFPATGPQFDNLLLYFLQQREGRSFGRFIKFDSANPPRVKVIFIDFIFEYRLKRIHYKKNMPIQVYRKLFHLQKLKISNKNLWYFCSKHRLRVLFRTAFARQF